MTIPVSARQTGLALSASCTVYKTQVYENFETKFSKQLPYKRTNIGLYTSISASSRKSNSTCSLGPPQRNVRVAISPGWHLAGTGLSAGRLSQNGFGPWPLELERAKAACNVVFLPQTCLDPERLELKTATCWNWVHET